jgi:hypothetical protein
MSETISFHEARELRLTALLHQGRQESWARLADLADNAEVAKVCRDHANAHAQYREMVLRKLTEEVA